MLGNGLRIRQQHIEAAALYAVWKTDCGKQTLRYNDGVDLSADLLLLRDSTVAGDARNRGSNFAPTRTERDLRLTDVRVQELPNNASGRQT